MLFCKNNLDVIVIEDECHFLTSCPAYTNIRNHYIKHILNKFNVNNELKMHDMLKTRNESWIKDISLYLYQATKIRLNVFTLFVNMLHIDYLSNF